MPALVRLDADGRLQHDHLHALGDGALHLSRQRRHVVLAAPVHHRDLVRPGAHRRACAVHGHVAAAHHHHALAREVRIVAVADGPQQIHCRDDAFGIHAVDAQRLARLRADGNVHRMVRVGDLGHFMRAHRFAAAGRDGAGVQNAADVLVQALARKAIRGDAVAQHAAQLGAFLEHRHAMPHKGEEVRAGEPAGPAADDGDGARGVHAARRGRHLVGWHLVDRELLDPADVDGRIDERAAAPRLARMLAHERASRGKRVILAHHVDGTGVVARRRERDVGGHVHVRGTQRLAGNRLADALLARTVAQMARILVGERIETLQHAAGGLVADGAIRRVADHLGQRAQALQYALVGVAVHHAFEHRRQLRDAVATRNALSAGLRAACLQHGQLHGQRAHARRRRLDTAREGVQVRGNPRIVARPRRNR